MNCYINADVSLSDEGSSSICMVFLSTTRNIIRHNLPLDFNQDFNLKRKCQDLKNVLDICESMN